MSYLADLYVRVVQKVDAKPTCRVAHHGTHCQRPRSPFVRSVDVAQQPPHTLSHNNVPLHATRGEYTAVQHIPLPLQNHMPFH
eukprot:1560453-Rhodomonas_salina.1